MSSEDLAKDKFQAKMEKRTEKRSGQRDGGVAVLDELASSDAGHDEARAGSRQVKGQAALGPAAQEVKSKETLRHALHRLAPGSLKAAVMVACGRDPRL